MSWRAFIPALLLAVAVLPPLRAQAPPAPRITQAVNDRQVVRLQGNTNPLARRAADRGAAAPGLVLDHMLLVLRHSPRQQAALAQLLDDQRENDSPQFHQWLTPQEFGARFGPAPADVATLTAWLAGEGFHLDHVAVGGGTIEFSGTAANVAAAFGTQMHRYLVDGAMHLANAGDPSIPAALAPLVAGIASLNDFRTHPASHVIGQGKGTVLPGQVRPSLNFTQNGTVEHALVPGDLGIIYNVGPSPSAGAGAGETIALVARSDIDANDVEEFDMLFMPGASGKFQMIQVGADPGVAINGDQDEATLDAEWANALAPDANVDLIVAGSTNTTDGVDLAAQYIVDHDLAPVMSTSFGLCEAQQGAAENTFWANLWEQASAEGITALVSSGDNGAAGCDDPNAGTLASQGLAVSGLASTPYDTAVGGTEFNEGATPGTYWSTTDASGYGSARGYIPEGAWNESSATKPSIWAGSGGVSSIYAKPPWQAGTGVPSDAHRDLPDIALTAASHDGYVVCQEESCFNGYDGFSFHVASGTSAASPAWAGIMALVDQQQGGRVGLANPVLYRLGSAAGVFHDVGADERVTPINNDVPCTVGTPDCTSGTLGYDVGPGFDLATGWGSPNIANLLQQWGSVKFLVSTTGLQLTLPQDLTYGQSVPVAIQVAAANGGPTPSGEVALLAVQPDASETEIGAYPLDGNGTVSVPALVLAAGNYAVVARYSGDLNYGASTSAPVSVNVGRKSPTIQVSFTATDPQGNPTPIAQASFGDTVVAHVTVSASDQLAVPTGTIQIEPAGDGGTPYEEVSIGLDSSGSATVADDPSQSPGTYSLVVHYSGDSNYLAAVNSATTVTIARSSPTLQITSVTAEGVNIVLQTGNGYLPPSPANMHVRVSAGGTIVTFADTYSFATNPDSGKPELDIVAAFSQPVPGLAAVYIAQADGGLDYLPSTSASFEAPTPPDLTFAPPSVDFDPIAIGTSSARALVLTNSGGMGAVLNLVTGNKAYTTSDDCGGTLASASSCNVRVTFTPYAGITSYHGFLTTGQAGAAGVALSGYSPGLGLTSTGNSSPLSAGIPATFHLELTPIHGQTGPVALACNGLPDFTACSFSPAIPVLDGTTATPVTLTVTYSPAASSSAPSSNLPVPWQLILVGGAGLLGITLAPRACGVRRWIWLGCLLTLAACGGGGGSYSSSSGGEPISPPPPHGQHIVQLTPSRVDFGEVQVGQASAMQTVAILNTGGVALRLSSLRIIGDAIGNGNDFKVNEACTVDVAPGGKCLVSLQFVPSAVGVQSGTFQVADSAADSPQMVGVTGTGVHTALAPATYWFTVTAQAGGQSQQLQLALTVP